ncbi:shikimate kinase [Helicobacter baculiformis]|uniref:Shikimate kinase n=1 Tax=Helicobacter baculiformis TaxID=427351 RepID=A0ABV7ZJ19_9HELI|nr:shikimate kinase [Helicobacter baculiformis]
MKLWLIGFMGSGKSTIGGLLASKLGYSFIDTDLIISQECGLSVEKIFARYGAPHFRTLEAQLIARLRAKSSCVIATGGGMPIYNKLGEGLVCYLCVDFEVLYMRLLQDGTPRPLFKDKTTLYQLYTERTPIYAHLAQHTFSANQTPPQVVAEILALLRQVEL